MNILIKNANLITMTDKDFEEGELVVSLDKIVFVGQKYEGDLVIDKTIDAKGNILMPGFVNAHTHTPMTFFKNISDGATLQTWLFDDILPMEKNWNPALIKGATRLGILEYLRAGITTFADAYYFAPEVAKVALDMGIRAVICVGFHPEDTRGIKEIEEEYLKIKSISNKTKIILYIHSIYTCDEGQIANIISLARKYNLGVYTHVSETLQEVGDCVVKHNMTPIQLLESCGFFDVPATVAHAVFADSQDIQILKQYQVSVVTNPASNLKLGSGIAPVNSFLSHNLVVGMGTDGPASNNALDMFREMYLFSTLQKALLRDASVVSAHQTLYSATVGGAKALGLDRVGKLKAGYFADLIMLDINTPNLTPLNNVKSAIVYSAGVHNVILTMVGGKILYQEGEFNLDTPYEEILQQAKEDVKKIIKSKK